MVTGGWLGRAGAADLNHTAQSPPARRCECSADPDGAATRPPRPHPWPGELMSGGLVTYTSPQKQVPTLHHL